MQGRYNVKNPEKYVGDLKNCIYRSSWERRFMSYLDQNPSVSKWGSEPFYVPYISPKDGRPHRYFIDFIVVTPQPDGTTVTTMIEVKPEKETMKPTKRGKKKERYLKECLTYSVNQAKWKAAEAVAVKKGWKFRVVTERDLYPEGLRK